MNKLWIPIVSVFFAVSPLLAEADIKLKTDLSHIVMSIDDRVVADLAMIDGVATWIGNLDSARVDTNASFVGFATHEVVAKLVAEGITFNRQKNLLGGVGLTNTRGVYVTCITKGRGETIPVAFSAFGIGLHASDGSLWHSGLSWISTDQNDWEPWPTNGG